MRTLLLLLTLLFACAAPASAERYQIKHQSVERMVRWLSERYPSLHFVAVEHGLEATGRAAVLKSMERDLVQLDQDGVEEEKEIKHSDLQEVKLLLSTLVPDVIIEMADERTLRLIGSSAAVEQALELLSTVDRPLPKLEVKFQLALGSPELDAYLGRDFEERGPRILRWEDERPEGLALTVLPVAPALPSDGQLASQTRQGVSGTEIDFVAESAALLVHFTATVKTDGYLVTKIVLELTVPTASGPRVVRHTSEVRIKEGETVVLALPSGGQGRERWLFFTPKTLPQAEE